MSYNSANKDLKFDVRMREIYLAKKLISAEEVASYESTLEDSANNAEAVVLKDENPAPEPAQAQPEPMTNQGFGGFSGSSDNSGNEGFGGNGFTF